MEIRDRIKELRRVKAKELVPNPRNWRTHPKKQQDALKGLLAEIGYADALLARELPDGSLMLVDGHLRAETTPNDKVPVLILDVTEEEANKLLLTLDPLAAMAEASTEALGKLLMENSSQNAAVTEMLETLAAENKVFEVASVPDADDKPADEISEESQKLQEFIRRRKESVSRGNDKAEVNFWVCLVFQSWLQKMEFLEKIADVPVLYGMYADGECFAERVGLAVTPNAQKPHTSPLEAKLQALVLLTRAAE
jgi:hypothetical protein